MTVGFRVVALWREKCEASIGDIRSMAQTSLPPAIPLFVRREDPHRGAPNAFPRELFPDPLFDAPANLLRLREADLDLDRLPLSGTGKDPRVEEPPEVVDFRGDLDFVLEEGR